MMSRPRPLHREVHPFLDQPGCFGCKAVTISFGAVPGGARKAGREKAAIQRREKGLEEYAKRRKAGEQPDGTTLEKINAYDRRVDTFEKLERDLREDNPPEQVEAVKKSTLNQR